MEERWRRNGGEMGEEWRRDGGGMEERWVRNGGEMGRNGGEMGEERGERWVRNGGEMEEEWRRDGGGMEERWGRNGGEMGEEWRRDGGGMEERWGRNGGEMGEEWRRDGEEWRRDGGGMEERWVRNGGEMGEELVRNGGEMGGMEERWGRNGGGMGERCGPHVCDGLMNHLGNGKTQEEERKVGRGLLQELRAPLVPLDLQAHRGLRVYLASLVSLVATLWAPLDPQDPLAHRGPPGLTGPADLSEGVLRNWKMVSIHHRVFKMHSRSGELEVLLDGIYFIYSQVMVDSTPFLRCTCSMETGQRKFNTCYTAGVSLLRTGQRISIRMVYEDTLISMTNHTTFLGS
ncbi:unnamed protein product, partial [Coregonus sp. 'balchen']